MASWGDIDQMFFAQLLEVVAYNPGLPHNLLQLRNMKHWMHSRSLREILFIGKFAYPI